MNNRPTFAVRTALALAASAALSAMPMAVQALGLGRLNVQSALGEGLRAEIDITSLSAEEASTLTVRVAPPDAYRSAGIDYNAVLAGAQASVVRGADGRSILRLSSSRAVQEPFVDVILEMRWATGRLVREFTLLFDPPGSRAAPPVQAAAPMPATITAAPPAQPAAVVLAQAPMPRPAKPAPAPAPAPAARPAPPAPVATPPRPAPAPAPVARANTAPASPVASAGKYEVKRGDTLSGVASRNLGGGVSLEQMLVGLYQANQEAFINDNINKLRAGAVLQVPAADAVRGIDRNEARKIIVAQSVDFGAYRNKLAQAAPQAVAQAPAAARQAQGNVQAKVDDKKHAAGASPDKLTLSGGEVNAPAASAAGKDNATRMAELSRNVEDLKKLQQGTAAATAPAVVAASPAPAAPAGADSGAGAGQPASAAVPAAPLAVPMAAARPPAPSATPPAPVAEGPGLMDSLSGSPWLLPGAGLLALLLAAVAAWRWRSRLGGRDSETSFLESRMQPDSFFGASGGQRVDTRDASGGSSNSSMGYSLSQLDAIGDVDPVAEADVYLAYGRDLQAEEILKEAMRATPDRLAVRTKLLEVYAKRRDIKGFELLATQLYALTKGAGPDWSRAQELGIQVDPENQLYQSGGHPEEIILDGERVVVEPLSATTLPHALTQAPVIEEDQGLGFERLDLELDLDLGGYEPPTSADEMTQPLASGAHRPIDRGLDFVDSTQPSRHPMPDDNRTMRLPLTQERTYRLPQADERTQRLPLNDERTVRSSLDDEITERQALNDDRTLRAELDLDSDAMALDEISRGGAGPSRSAEAMDFDEFALSQPLDLDITAPGQLEGLDGEDIDPLARKLELADEFRQIGDLEGARDLLNEVVAKAGGAMRAKAQAMLDALG